MPIRSKKMLGTCEAKSTFWERRSRVQRQFVWAYFGYSSLPIRSEKHFIHPIITASYSQQYTCSHLLDVQTFVKAGHLEYIDHLQIEFGLGLHFR